jgi:WS/DGAT/MGAT family acyltransferase
MDIEPTGRRIRPPRMKLHRGEYHLGVAELLAAAIGNTAQQVVKLVKSVPTVARVLGSMVRPEPGGQGQRRWQLLETLKALTLAPRTSLNVAITNQRRFAARTVPLAEVKEIAKRAGVSLNDVVMGTVAGALRDYFVGHRELPAKSLSAAVPISLREAGDETANNQVSMMLITLATHLADPLERLRAIAASSTRAKSMMGQVKAAIPMDFPMLAAPWLMSGLASLYGRSRLANVLPPVANVLISNVPGVQAQLYFAGAKVNSYYPVSIPAHGMALNVTVQSYNGRLDYGLIACRRALPDIMDLADALLAEHRMLLQTLRAQDAALAAQASAPALPEPVATPVPIGAKPARRRAAQPGAAASAAASSSASLSTSAGAAGSVGSAAAPAPPKAVPKRAARTARVAARPPAPRTARVSTAGEAAARLAKAA